LCVRGQDGVTAERSRAGTSLVQKTLLDAARNLSSHLFVLMLMNFQARSRPWDRARSVSTLSGSIWLPARVELSATAVATMLVRGERLFRVYIPLNRGEAPVPVTYHFDPLAVRCADNSWILGFSLTSRESGLFPSFCGEMITRRFGTSTRLTVRCTYEYEDGSASRLFQDALGKRLADAIFPRLTSVLKLIAYDAARRPLQGLYS
jgi:hypothetical protein